MLKNVDLNREYISTPEAAKRSKLSRVYIAQLLRKGTLDGFRLGREGFIYADSLEQFLATNRRPGPKPGPKGPRKKPTSNLS
jgi:excisionase family DNA binding protein